MKLSREFISIAAGATLITAMGCAAMIYGPQPQHKCQEVSDQTEAEARTGESGADVDRLWVVPYII